MENLLQPYEGSAPYVFVSYSHKDSDRVFPILQRLQAEGLRIWYDKGIEWGSEWDIEIGNHIVNCECLIAFHSNNSKESTYCRREIAFSSDYQKNILSIYLEAVEFDNGMKLRLALHQATYFYQYSVDEMEDFYSRLFEKTSILQPCYNKNENTINVLQLDNLQNNNKAVVHKVDDIYKEVTTPIIFILDTSGSMSGYDIENLKNSLEQTIANLRNHSMESKMKNLAEMNSYAYVTYKIAIITFDSYAKILMNYTDVDKINGLPNFKAFGGTNLDDALKHAKNIIENPAVTLEDWRNPSVILVTDGCPIGGYQKTLNNFITKGRSAKCNRYAIGIGDNYDKKMLTTFAHTSIEAKNSSELASALRVFINDIIARMILILW